MRGGHCSALRTGDGHGQLVVSELVANARKYAPGPCLLDLEIIEGAVEISVWNSSTTLPSIEAAHPARIGPAIACRRAAR
ncbi:signal transduction histidine kinase [Streptomyces sp. B4I13]|uniref:hypothetical protein n=1 Tax=Streptomyces sp. B4I13 TaxID=3042271 RepID=UPI002782F347|nr:signal transduction histidine kinase [Streptomyces sp. B4I13]